MDRKSFIVHPFGKYGHAYELDTALYLIYTFVFYATGAAVVLLAIVVLFAPKFTDLILPGTSTNPLLPFMPLAIAGFGVWAVILISSQGRQLDSTETPAQSGAKAPSRIIVFTRVLRVIALGVLALMSGVALVSEMTVDHKMNPEVAVGFVIIVGLLFVISRSRKK